MIIQNLSELSGTAKMRNHWEEKICYIDTRKNSAVYKVQCENENCGKTKILHRNMLMLRNMLIPCDNLLDNFDWNITDSGQVKKKGIMTF